MLTPVQKSRLAWRCRRGMLELDLILQRFLETGFPTLNAQQIIYFETLLGCPDPDLFAWLMGHQQPDDYELNQIVTVIRAYC